jgi:uncharacterized protein HemX
MNKKVSNLLKTLFFILFLTNFCALGWFYHLLDLKTLKLQNLETHLQSSEKEIEHLHNQLLKKQTESLQKQSLLQIEFLLRQAQWQLDVLGQVHIAKKYLQLAKALSQERHWSVLAEHIQSDLLELKKITFTSSATLVYTISKLQNHLENKMQLTEKTLPLQSHSQTLNHPLLETLKPFVRIERYQANTQKVFSPNQVDDILKNILALLPQIQFLGITHQEKVYQVLVENLKKNLELLPFSNEFQADIQTLQSYQFKLKKHISLQSRAIIEQMIKDEGVL